MSEKKLFCLDIDGTIRDFDGFIPESAITAIRRARAEGHKVCIATGRMPARVDPAVKAIGFDGMITCSGSVVEYEGKTVCVRGFEQEIYRKFVQEFLAAGGILELENQWEAFYPACCHEGHLVMNERMNKAMGMGKPGGVRRVSTRIDHPEDRTDIVKIVAYTEDMDKEEVLKRWGEDLHMVDLSVNIQIRWAGEVTPKGVDKATALDFLAEAADIPLADTVAIGDNENDYEIIRKAGIGIAMGNATEGAKRAADYVTADLREDGIEKAFAHVLGWK